MGFVEDLEDIGKKLGQTQKSFDDAKSKLSSGRGNLIRQVEMVKKLGVKPTKKLPEQLLDDDLDDAVQDEQERDGKEISSLPVP